MEWKNLEAGKKAAQELAPDPIEHTPEAPVITEEEAQVLESPEGAEPSRTPDEMPPDDVRRQAGQDDEDPDGIRIKPE